MNTIEMAARLWERREVKGKHFISDCITFVVRQTRKSGKPATMLTVSLVVAMPYNSIYGVSRMNMRNIETKAQLIAAINEAVQLRKEWRELADKERHAMEQQRILKQQRIQRGYVNPVVQRVREEIASVLQRYKGLNNSEVWQGHGKVPFTII